MKRKLILECAAAIVIVAVLGIVLYFVLGDPVVDVSQINGITAYGKNRETGMVSSANLESDDVNRVVAIFNGKKKTTTSPGDVFSEDCAFALTDGDTEFYYCLANDGSNYICSANDDMYFAISDDERSTLVKLLADYCGYSD